jgi:O-antigen/teichoic acid export membrane protein
VVVASLRYEMAIPLPESEETAANLLVLSLATVVGMSLLFSVGIWLLQDQIVGWINTPTLRPYLWLLPLGLLGAGAYRVLNYWAVRREAFTHVARTKLSQGLAMMLTQVGLGFLKLGPVGLLLGDVVGRSAGCGTLASLTLRRDRATIKQTSLKEMRLASIRYRKFPLLASGSSLLNSAGLQLPAILLAAFYGTQVAGWFALGQRVLGIPIALIGWSVAQVYMGEVSRLARDNPTALRQLFMKTAQKLLLVGVGPTVLLMFSGPQLFMLVFGEAWREAGVYLQLLGLMFLIQFVAFPLSQTLVLLERQDLQVAWDTGRLVLTVSALAIASSTGLESIAAIVLYSAAMTVAYAALFVMSAMVISRMRTFEGDA